MCCGVYLISDLCFQCIACSHKATQEAVSAMDVDPLTETTDFEAVRDNRDCRIMLSWDPPHRWIVATFLCVTVTEALVLRPLLEDRGHITESIHILNGIKKKCFQISTKWLRRSQQYLHVDFFSYCLCGCVYGYSTYWHVSCCQQNLILAINQLLLPVGGCGLCCHLHCIIQLPKKFHCHTPRICNFIDSLVGCIAQLAERRSLAGELTLFYARPVADG